MPQFSITDKENLQKIKTIFENNSSNNRTLKPKEFLKFVSDIGLNNQLFLQDLNYYLPHIAAHPISFQQTIKFLDFIISSKYEYHTNIQAFKCFDKNGLGQIPTADILASLKKKLSSKEYEQYSQLITQSYGTVLNYMELFKQNKKGK